VSKGSDTERPPFAFAPEALKQKSRPARTLAVRCSTSGSEDLQRAVESYDNVDPGEIKAIADYNLIEGG
jgi:hypothetical protein